MNARKTVRQPDGLRNEEPVRDDVWKTACVVPPRKLARAPSLDIYVGEFSSSINAPQCADPELATNSSGIPDGDGIEVSISTIPYRSA